MLPEDGDLASMPNRVTATMDGRKIFISGGSGFMGKVLVEKMLRCCPGLDTLFMLIRPKKGKEVKQRLDDIFSSALFDTVRAERGPDIFKKVVGICGDVTSDALGISAQDRQMLCDEVSIVYHCAATIRFDEPLKKAVYVNTRGTKQMLELAKDMKKLEGFFHVSTAYCHLGEKVLYEKAYPPPADPHKIIKLCETMDDELVEAMTKKILGTCPNTYAYTKALSEGLVSEQMGKIPVMILRPSIVIPIWKEPLPGWTDNINGPTGLLIGAGKGVIRTMHCNQDGYADYVPVDIAVNGILVATWHFISNGDKDRNVVHLTSNSEFQITWAEIIERGRRITERVPLNNVVWYPGGSMKKSRLQHNICVFFFHLLPAILIDTIIFLAGHKPIMMRVHRRIMKGMEIFEYYANNVWDFKNDLAVEVRKIMNEREKKELKVDGDDLDIDKYFEDCIHAARIYILHEPPETLPAARRHLRMMYWVDVFAKILFTGLIFWMLYSWSDSIFDFMHATVKFVQYILSPLASIMGSNKASSVAEQLPNSL